MTQYWKQKLQEEPNGYDGIEEEVNPVLLAELAGPWPLGRGQGAGDPAGGTAWGRAGPAGIHRDTCLASIHRVASCTVVNSTKAKPLDAPRRKNTHKQVLINDVLKGGMRDTQRRTLKWPWVGPVATNQPLCAHLAGF